MSRVMVPTAREEVERRGNDDDLWAWDVKALAGFRCQGCGMTDAQIQELGGQLQAAHILPWAKYRHLRLDRTNGRALCTFKNPRHLHPRGLGGGFGCHNEMSNHWRPRPRPTVRGLIGARPEWRHPFAVWFFQGMLAFFPVAFVYFLAFPLPFSEALGEPTLAQLMSALWHVVVLTSLAPFACRLLWRSGRRLIRRSPR